MSIGDYLPARGGALPVLLLVAGGVAAVAAQQATPASVQASAAEESRNRLSGASLRAMASPAEGDFDDVNVEKLGFQCEVVLAEDLVAGGADRGVRSRSLVGRDMFLGRPDCDGPCRIDIGFIHGDDVLDGIGRVRTPDGEGVGVHSLGALELLLESWVDHASGIWQANGLDAELRFAGLVRDPRLTGASSRDESWLVDLQRFEKRFNAHLVYAVVPRGRIARGVLGLISPATRRRPADPYFKRDIGLTAGVLPMSYLGALTHELGHNLGLHHDPATAAKFDEGPPIWQGGRGFAGRGAHTIMAYWTRSNPVELPRYSTSSSAFVSPETGKRYPLGQKGVHESLEVLRWNIPRMAEPPPPENVVPELDCSPFYLGDEVHGFGHRFEVGACFGSQDAEGAWSTRPAVDYDLDAAETALFSFFDRDNVELLVKVLDACDVNGHRWVFVGAATDLPFRLWVTDLGLSRIRFYGNPAPGVLAIPQADTMAFPCDATAASWGMATAASLGLEQPAPQVLASGRPKASTESLSDCEPGRVARTFEGGFKVSMCYETGSGRIGDALGWGLDSSESELLYFFDRDNVEALVKVLDGCGVNGHRWVFVAPLTDLAFNLRVEGPDGRRWIYANRLGQPADAARDVMAFPCEPGSSVF